MSGPKEKRVPTASFTIPSARDRREAASPGGSHGTVDRLRAMATRALPRMYLPDQSLFAFTERRGACGLTLHGVSPRYSAIALIGIEADRRTGGGEILSDAETSRLLDRLLAGVAEAPNLGDAALIAWAAAAHGRTDRGRAWERVSAFQPHAPNHPIVDLAWTLAALCVDRSAPAELRDRTADRLLDSFDERSSLFVHDDRRGGLRSHVSCFADAVYPIHALSLYSAATGNRRALTVASRCAAHVCEMQGRAGQWWWHYDCRTGSVVERYPVYAIHQDAMAPMALFALDAAGGVSFARAVERGLTWLTSAPELHGGSLVDLEADTVWRKVARREPGKAARYLQAGASALHPRLRVPALDTVFPPTTIDYEDRPYHWGWLLYAWAGRPRVSNGNPS